MKTRAGLAAAALLLAGGLAAYPLAAAGGFESLFRLAGLLALALLLAGLSGLAPASIAVALALLAAEFLAGLAASGSTLDLASPVYAGGLFLCGELAYASLEAGRPGALGGRRLWPAVGLVLLAGLAAGYLLLVVALLPLPGGLALTALAGLGAVGLLGLAGRLAGRV